MDNSILTSTKKLIGITEQDESFDTDIITHINMAFTVLHRLGAGPKTGFRISDKTAQWEDFTEDELLLADVKDYVYLKVKQVFDPPASSILIEAEKSIREELEMTINLHVENETNQNEGGDTHG